MVGPQMTPVLQHHHYEARKNVPNEALKSEMEASVRAEEVRWSPLCTGLLQKEAACTLENSKSSIVQSRGGGLCRMPYLQQLCRMNYLQYLCRITVGLEPKFSTAVDCTDQATSGPQIYQL